MHIIHNNEWETAHQTLKTKQAELRPPYKYRPRL